MTEHRGKPLEGVKVLDLSRMLAAPLAGQILADFGADVVKVEREGVGDDIRYNSDTFLPDPSRDQGRDSSMFLSVNRNKRGITVDLSTEEGQDVVRLLADKSDILIENYKPGTLTKFRLGYETLSQSNSGLIYCSLTAFGSAGKFSRLPGYDPVFQAISGLMSLNGLPDDMPGGGPVRTGINWIDLFGGLQLTIGVLAALHERDVKSGQGQHVEVALMDCAISALAGPLQSYLISGKLPERLGNRAPSAGPVGLFPCSDGAIFISVGNDGQFAALCRALGRPELAKDDKYALLQNRARHKPELEQVVKQLTQSLPRRELETKLSLAGIPVGVYNDLGQAMRDPHVIDRDMVVPLEHTLKADLKMVGNPVQFSETPVTYDRSSPLLGEHTDEVLGDVLGMSPQEIASLRERNIV